MSTTRIAELASIKLVTVATAAETLGVGKSTIYRLMDDRALPYVRIGKSARRIPMSALLEFVKTHKIGG